MAESKNSVSASNVSILIITLNEEKNLRRAIESVSWSDDIVILDSYSTDSTKEIASRYQQVRIFERNFDDYASQRNYGLHSINYLHEWAFLLDADEVCPKELGNEIIQKTGDGNLELAAFIVRRRDFFQGKWMRCHYPVWIERLVRPDRVTFIGTVHEKLSYKGSCGRLQNDLVHFPFDNGIDNWIARHNQYSTAMAALERETVFKWAWNDLFSPDPLCRSKAHKKLYHLLPGRWVIYFIHRYFIKGGILDGVSGFHFVMLETFYHFSAVVKIREEQRKMVVQRSRR
jgi:glycosyltransferase involved in cell wall biosynthesis